MLLEIYQNYLKQHNVEKEQIIAINFENLDYEELTDYKKLYNYLLKSWTKRRQPNWTM